MLLKNLIFRCYAELNDFLPEEWRQKPFIYAMKTPITAAEAIESLGIPLSEVDLVLVNGQPVSRSHRLFENDYISVYPAFETLDISELKENNVPPLRITRFILDAHLGKLAKYLRMLGFDTLYQNDFEDSEIVEKAAGENRIILTRDKNLLKSIKVTHGYYVRAIEKHDQLREVVRKFDLYSQFKSFTRCMTCNAELVSIEKHKIMHNIPPEVANSFEEFFYCAHCEKVYWKGSHFNKMEEFIRSLLNLNHQ